MEPAENTKPENTNTVPAFCEEIVSQLADADVLEWLRRKLKAPQAANAAIATLSFHAKRYDRQCAIDHEIVFYIPESRTNSAVFAKHSKSTDAALRIALNAVGKESPAKLAAKKRAEAARLLADAEAIEAQNPAVA